MGSAPYDLAVLQVRDVAIVLAVQAVVFETPKVFSLVLKEPSSGASLSSAGKLLHSLGA